MEIYLAPLVTVIGLAMFFMKDPNVKDIGRLAFFAGLLVSLFMFSRMHVMSIH